jgi:RNA polymerase sigma factor (sigma-70 family)
VDDGGFVEKGQWFAQVLRTYEKGLIRFASKKVSISVAHEMVQETFLKLWSQNENSLDGHEGPWLYTVTRNLCLDYLKKDRPQSLDDSQMASGDESAQQKIEREETESQVSHSLRSLSESQQEVIRLKFQDGFSYKEISEITGHSVSYVGVLIHEGITKLRQDLRPLVKGTQEVENED